MQPPVGIVPGLVGLHHVALAVADLDASLATWVALTGGRVALRARVEDQGVEAAVLEFAGAAGAPGLASGTELELVAPLATDGSLHRFLERRGEGLHHVAWAVRGVATALEALERSGMRLIDAEPRIGLHGTPVAFLHPAATGGVLVELVEVPAP